MTNELPTLPIELASRLRALADAVADAERTASGLLAEYSSGQTSAWRSDHIGQMRPGAELVSEIRQRLEVVGDQLRAAGVELDGAVPSALRLMLDDEAADRRAAVLERLDAEMVDPRT